MSYFFSKIVEQRAKTTVTPIKMVSYAFHRCLGTVWNANGRITDCVVLKVRLFDSSFAFFAAFA